MYFPQINSPTTMESDSVSSKYFVTLHISTIGKKAVKLQSAHANHLISLLLLLSSFFVVVVITSVFIVVSTAGAVGLVVV